MGVHKYTEEERRNWCKAVFDVMRSSANSSSSACKQCDIKHNTFNRWLEDLGLVEEYTIARDDMHDRIADDALSIADSPPALTPEGKIDNGDVNHKRLRVDTRKWLLSKIASKKYGDKLDHTSSDGTMSPPNNITLTPLKK